MRQIPIYWINLALRPDRRAFMEEQFDRLKLKATRIEAVTPADLAADQVSKRCDPRRSRSMTKAQYAGNLSHKSAWERFVDSGEASALFLEDDAILSASLPRFLDRAADGFGEVGLIRIETWQLGHLPFSTKETDALPDIKLRDCLARDAGAAGYILTRQAAVTALALPSFHHRLVDGFLFDPFGLGRRVQTRYTDPGLCIQLCNLTNDRPEAKSSIGGVGVAEHNALKERRSFGVQCAKQIGGWMEYDLPRAAAFIRNLGKPLASLAIPFEPD